VKTIGLLGGTSWPSTIDYYRILNELAQERLGGFHSADLLLRSIDYHAIKSRYYDRWHDIPTLLRREIENFVALGPSCLILCNNTLHKAYDDIAADLDLRIPVFHAVTESARAAQALGAHSVLLLGTQFTMEDGFYQLGLERAGLVVTVPDAADRSVIQAVQSELARGALTDEHRRTLTALIGKHAGRVDAAVLACTELPLAVTPQNSPLPLVNPTAAQCRAAFDYAIAP
jgi:aspartate racemase